LLFALVFRATQVKGERRCLAAPRARGTGPSVGRQHPPSYSIIHRVALTLFRNPDHR
jgi:hypothetical protein